VIPTNAVGTQHAAPNCRSRPHLKSTFLALSKCWEKSAIKLEEAFAQLTESEAQDRTPESSERRSQSIKPL
jgi:hypothetical protein